MSIKFYSNDLPAARAYAANKLSACGYEDEAEIVREDAGFHLDASRLVHNFISNAVVKLTTLWALVIAAKAPARQIPSAGANL